MPNFITKILIADFLSNFKVAELEHEFEPGDLGHRVAYCMDDRMGGKTGGRMVPANDWEMNSTDKG